MTGPDTFRMELVEDPRIPAPVVSHHLHYWLEQPLEVKKFYVQKLLLKPTMRGPYESADVPGMNLTLAPLGSQKVPGVPMKGRLMDSIGFDVPNLKAYVDKIAANGVKFDVPYGRDAELGSDVGDLDRSVGRDDSTDGRTQQDRGRDAVQLHRRLRRRAAARVMPKLPFWVRVFVLPVGGCALATLITWKLWPFIQPSASPLFFLAVMISALYGGVVAGLIATFCRPRRPPICS